MTVYDEWSPDDGSCFLQADEDFLHTEVTDEKVVNTSLSSSSSSSSCSKRIIRKKSLRLSLGDLTYCESLDEKYRKGSEYRTRLQNAKHRHDVDHLDIHYSCIGDKDLMEALIDLLTCDRREWYSFTLNGIIQQHRRDTVSLTGDRGGIDGDDETVTRMMTRHIVSLKDIAPLFAVLAERKVKSINLYNCTLSYNITNTGGCVQQALLDNIPFMSGLRELRIHGAAIDRRFIRALIQGLNTDPSSTTTVPLNLLSLRACNFVSELENDSQAIEYNYVNNTFQDLVDGIGCMEYLKTLNLCFCNLEDDEIIYLINSMKTHPSIESLHIGGNHCVTMKSVRVISSWIEETTQLRDLNLRSLWLGFAHGLVQRAAADLSCLFQAIRINSSLTNLTLSENYLTATDIHDLSLALRYNRTMKFLDLAHNYFEEDGAVVILDMLRNENPVLEQLRFENHFCRYQCSDEIKMYTYFNWIDQRLLMKRTKRQQEQQLQQQEHRVKQKLSISSASRDFPLALWPNAIARINKGCDERYHTMESIPDVIFRVLSSPNGESGLPLAVRVALAM